MGSVQKMLFGIGIMLASILFYLTRLSGGAPFYFCAILIGIGFLFAGLKNDSGHWPWDDKE
ncbi:MAG: hypothetical protein RRY53_06465 [Pseudoflavonifractor sp.]